MLDLARVVAVHPESNSVDLVTILHGRCLTAVQVLSPMAGSQFGAACLPEPGLPAGADPYDCPRTGRDVLAVIGEVPGGLPIVVGFLFPQVSECLFEEKDRQVVRHPSDFYWSVDGKGNAELRHPSGTYIRIGTNPAHEDLSGRDFDKRWAIKRNTDKPVHLHLQVENGGGRVASLDIDPAGNVALDHLGHLSVNTGGNANVTVAGDTTVNSGGPALLKAPEVTIDSPSTTCTGHLAVLGGLSAKGGTGASVQIEGSVKVSSGDVDVDGITVKGHKHREQGDGALVSPPVS